MSCIGVDRDDHCISAVSLLNQQLLVQEGIFLRWKDANIFLKWLENLFKVLHSEHIHIGQWFSFLIGQSTLAGLGIWIMQVESGLKPITIMYLTICTFYKNVTWWIIKLSYNEGLHKHASGRFGCPRVSDHETFHIDSLSKILSGKKVDLVQTQKASCSVISESRVRVFKPDSHPRTSRRMPFSNDYTPLLALEMSDILFSINQQVMQCKKHAVLLRNWMSTVPVLEAFPMISTLVYKPASRSVQHFIFILYPKLYFSTVVLGSPACDVNPTTD